VELLHLMPAAASANWYAALTMEGIKLEALAAEATWWQLELSTMCGNSRSFMCPVISNLRRVMRTSPKRQHGLNDRPAATKRESEIGNPWRAVGISRARMLPPRSC
jgi:hypothetical protein